MLLALIIARPSDMNLVIGLETPALRAALTEMGAEYQESGAKTLDMLKIAVPYTHN